MANIFETELEENPSTTVRGRKQAIEDELLWSNRDHLVGFLENTWPDIGGRLARVKTPSELLDVLQVWKQHNGHYQHYITQTLLQESCSPASANVLNERRRRLSELNVACSEARENLSKCREALEVATRALSPNLSNDDRAVVEEHIAKRTKKLTEAEEELHAANRRRSHLEQQLRDGESYFARAEFVDFCRSRRYRLTPLNLANALAGVPAIGWRQSIKRSQGEEPHGANGGTIQIFETIRRIVRSGTRRSLLVPHAEQWLRARGNTKNYGTSELQKTWHYLKWAIKTVLESSPRVPTRELPFAIAREYDKRKFHPSDVDRLFAEEECIVGKPRKSRPSESQGLGEQK